MVLRGQTLKVGHAHSRVWWEVWGTWKAGPLEAGGGQDRVGSRSCAASCTKKHSGQSRHLGHQHPLSASFASWLTNEPCFCRHVLPWPSATLSPDLKNETA